MLSGKQQAGKGDWIQAEGALAASDDSCAVPGFNGEIGIVA